MNKLIPEFIEDPKELEPKEVKNILKNTACKLAAELMLLNLAETSKVIYVREVRIFKSSNSEFDFLTLSNHLTNNIKGLADSFDKKIIKEESGNKVISWSDSWGARKVRNNFTKIIFENSFYDLEYKKQKSIVNKIEKLMMAARSAERIFPRNSGEIRDKILKKFQTETVIAKENANDFVNDHLPDEWGKKRRAFIEEKAIAKELNKDKATLKNSKIKL